MEGVTTISNEVIAEGTATAATAATELIEATESDVEVIDASFGQERLWFLDRLSRDSSRYLIGKAWRDPSTILLSP